MKHSLKELLNWLVQDGEMRKRLLFTVGVIVLLKIVIMIPVPGVDHSAMKSFMSSLGGKMTPIFKYGAWESGAFQRVSIFSLGIMPFITSCGLLQLASVVIPPLRRQLLGNESGRARIVRYTFIMTAVLSLIQSFMLSQLIQSPNYFSGIAMVPEPGFRFVVTCMLTMTAAVALMIFLAEVINRHGIGNGYAWIAISSLFFNFVMYCYRFSSSLIDNEPARKISTLTALLIGALAVALVYGCYYVYNKKTALNIRRNNVEAGSIHFRSTIVGREPIPFAEVIALLPVVIASFMPAVIQPYVPQLRELFDRFYLAHLLYFVVAIYALTFLYSRIVFDSKRLTNLIKNFGFSVEAEAVEQKMKENLKIAALFLIGAFMLPALLKEYVGVNELGGKSSMAFSLIPHFSIALFTAVILDTLSQSSFFKTKQESEVKDWGICYTAFTETEAELKALYLEGRGIKSLIEPLRFSWGVPIRTAIDQYRIYTPADKTAQARDLILKAENFLI